MAELSVILNLFNHELLRDLIIIYLYKYSNEDCGVRKRVS